MRLYYWTSSSSPILINLFSSSKFLTFYNRILKNKIRLYFKFIASLLPSHFVGICTIGGGVSNWDGASEIGRLSLNSHSPNLIRFQISDLPLRCVLARGQFAIFPDCPSFWIFSRLRVLIVFRFFGLRAKYGPMNREQRLTPRAYDPLR